MDESELPRRLSNLWEIEVTERTKAIKLLSKIFNKILNNPSTKKFSDLNFHKLRTKFVKCRPGFYLLYEAGFKQSMDGQRLQWTYNSDNFISLKKVNNSLQESNTNIHKPQTQKIDTDPKPKEWKQIQQKIKKQQSEKEKKRNLIKEKIAMQRKEQKIEQKRLLDKVKEKKEKQKQQATQFIKAQMMNGMNEIMQEMMKSILPQNVDENKESISENVQQNTENTENTDNKTLQLDEANVDDKKNNEQVVDIGYDETVVNNLVELEIGTREQCIEASKLANDYKDPNCVVEVLEVMLNNEEKGTQISDKIKMANT